MLLFRKGIATRKQPVIWLSLFVFLCALYICPWMMGFAGWYDTQPYRDIIFYIPFSQQLFIGPVLYFYVQSLLNPDFRLNKVKALHLLPGIVYLIYNLVIFITDKIILDDYYFLADGTDREFDVWYTTLGWVSLMLYFSLSLRYYYLYRRIMMQTVSYADSVVFKWVRNILVAYLLMQLLQLSFHFIIIAYPEFDSYTGSWWYFFIFSGISYYIGFNGYTNTVNAGIPFRISLFPQKLVLLPENKEDISEEIDFEVIETSAINNSFQDDEWADKITHAFEDDALYTNPELSLPDVAHHLGTNNATISKTINVCFKLNFNDFVNKYRIQAVKDAIDVGIHKKQTLLSIAFDCGFNSKATFNRAFKKHTGTSPKDYISSL